MHDPVESRTRRAGEPFPAPRSFESMPIPSIQQNRARPLLFLMLLAATAPGTARAGAWIRPSGSTFVKTSWISMTSGRYATLDGRRLETAEFRTRTLDLYAEVGLGAGFDATIRLPAWKSSSFAETSESNGAPGDLCLEARYGIARGRTPVALGLAVDLPTGDGEGKTPLLGEAGAQGGFVYLPTGDGAAAVRMNLYASRALESAPVYLAGEVGYRLRFEGLNDEYRVWTEAGWNPLGGLWLKGFASATGPADAVDRNLARSSTNGFGEGVRSAIVGGGVAVAALRGVALSFDVQSTVGSIRNSYEGTTFLFGLAWER